MTAWIATHTNGRVLHFSVDDGWQVEVVQAEQAPENAERAAALIEQLARERDAHEKAGRGLYAATEKAIADREAAEERARAAEKALDAVRQQIELYAEWKPEPTLAYRDDCIRPGIRKALSIIDAARKGGEK